MNNPQENFKNRPLKTRCLVFNRQPACDDDELGWNMPPHEVTFENHKGKFYPILVLLIADNLSVAESQNGKPWTKGTKVLFSKFHTPSMPSVILDISILCISHKNKNPLFKYNHKKYQWDPIKLSIKRYEFLLSDFWEKYQIYKEPYHVEYGGGPKCLYSELDDDWQRIFMRIWKIHCIAEGRATIPEWDFMKQLYPLRCLAQDLVSQDSLLTTKEKRFQYKMEFYINYHLEETPFEGVNYKNWSGRKSITRKRAYSLRLLDACFFLNNFFEKFNYSTMQTALELFLIKMYQSLADELVTRKLLIKCGSCGDYFIFKKGKKYCSLRSDSKDCGTKARNKRYYTKHKPRILPKAKEYARKYRKE